MERLLPAHLEAASRLFEETHRNMVTAPSFTEGKSYCKVFTSCVSTTKAVDPKVPLFSCPVASLALSSPAALDRHKDESRVLGQTSGDIRGVSLHF